MENREQALFDVQYNCLFCGGFFVEKFPRDIGERSIDGCYDCTVYGVGVGRRVRYGAWPRDPAHAVYADKHLERNAIYTVRKVARYQHGSFFYLRETGNAAFATTLFTPADKEAFYGARVFPDANSAALSE